MDVPVIAFFNHKGDVGKTSLAYHLSWMYADLGYSVLAADLDPQANLTAAFLDEGKLESLMDKESVLTIFDIIKPLLKGTGDIQEPNVLSVDGSSFPEDAPGLLLGDLRLSEFEDELADSWSKCLDGGDRAERAFRVSSAFRRIIRKAGMYWKADIALIDLGPNLGAINRAVLIAADYVVIPLQPDLYSLKGLENLGPALHRWRQAWEKRLEVAPEEIKDQLPPGIMEPIGYIALQHAIRLDRPVKSYQRWMDRIPKVYSRAILNTEGEGQVRVENDPNCLALLKHYRSLMPMAMEARKPMFMLRPADGALGAHMQAVTSVGNDFRQLARSIAEKVGAQPSSG